MGSSAMISCSQVKKGASHILGHIYGYIFSAKLSKWLLIQHGHFYQCTVAY